MALRLIVNADDMGLTPGVTRGIVRSATEGIVSSTSLMANMPSAREAADTASKYRIAVGLHLNLTTGKPVSPPSEVPSLLQADGLFYPYDELVQRLLSVRISMRDVYRELCAQVDAALRMGIRPTHLDTHHTVHLWLPFAWVMLKVGRRYGIEKARTTRTTDMAFRVARPATAMRTWGKRRYKALIAALLGTWFRMPTWRMAPSAFGSGQNAGDHSQLEGWLFFVRQLKRLSGTDVVEVPCHPGYVDDELRGYSNWTHRRDEEVVALTSQRLKAAVSEAGIQVISFRDF